MWKLRPVKCRCVCWLILLLDGTDIFRSVWYGGHMAKVAIEFDISENAAEYVDSQWCARVFSMTYAAVNHAARTGQIPALRIGKSWAYKPEDALRLWGHRLPNRRVTITNT